MARYIFQNQVKDGMGRVIQGASVNVYLAGTNTPATIYGAIAGGIAIVGSVLTADATGFFKFFADTSDYANTQFFKVVVSMPGYNTQTYDQIAILH